MDALEVLDTVRHRCARQPLQQVERLAHGCIADGVRGDGYPVPGGQPHGLDGRVLARHRHAPVAASFVGLEHPCGPAAETAVEEELDPTHAEPGGTGAAPLAAADEIRQRSDGRVEQHAELEVACLLETTESGPGALVLHVMDSGDPQAVRLGLRLAQGLVQDLVRRRWNDAGNELHGALQQQAGRLTRGVPPDPILRRRFAA